MSKLRQHFSFCGPFWAPSIALLLRQGHGKHDEEGCPAIPFFFFSFFSCLKNRQCFLDMKSDVCAHHMIQSSELPGSQN